MENFESFVSGSRPLLVTFSDFAVGNNLENLFLIDHICYRCSSSETYEKIRRIFEHDSKFIYQSIISNRRISIIKFSKPIKTLFGELKYLELSDQKPDNSQVEGFDHLEIIPVNYVEKNSYENFVKLVEEKCKNKGIEIEKKFRPHHTTYDIKIGEYNIKLSPEFLIEKVKKEELN